LIQHKRLTRLFLVSNINVMYGIGAMTPSSYISRVQVIKIKP
jgi:hypothetical protein